MVRTALRNRGLAEETLLPPALVLDPLTLESGESPSGVVLGEGPADEKAPDHEGFDAEAMAKWKKATTRAK